MNPARRSLLIVLLAVGLVLSILLLLAHHGEGPAASAVSAVCGEGKESGCAVVNTSRYSIFAGVPVAAFGIIFYASLALLAILTLFAGPEAFPSAQALLVGALGLGLLVDLALLGVQAFAIRAYCKLCVSTYAVNIAALLLIRPFPLPGFAALASRESRLLMAGWGLGSLAIVAAAFSGETALALREKARAPQFFGGSVAGSSDAEVKRLQGILDDPVKLDLYLHAKASKEFDDAPVRTLDLAGVPFRGPEASPIKVVDYSDFLCPFCRQAAQGLAEWLPHSGGRVALYYKNYPLDTTCNDRVQRTVHAGACFLALGGICAQDQGKFWPYHDKVFSQALQNPTAQDVLRVGASAGLDPQAFAACVDSGRTKERLMAQIHEAADGGVQSTPTLFINGKKLPRTDHFFESINKESGRLGLPPLPSPSP